MNKNPVKQNREDFDPEINKLADEHDSNHPTLYLPSDKICILCSHKKTLGIMDTLEKINNEKK